MQLAVGLPCKLWPAAMSKYLVFALIPAKNEMVRYMSFLLSLFILVGCNDFAVKKHVMGNYYLTAADERDACNLSYLITRSQIYATVVGAKVFAIGHNRDYLIIKQHPRNSPYPPDMELVNYYILPILDGSMNWENKNGLIGPLTLTQFQDSLNELGITTNIAFTILIE